MLFKRAASTPSSGSSGQPRALIVGLGSGRSGTVSLAELLSLQRGVAVSHERLEFNLRAEGCESLVLTFLKRITSHPEERIGAQVVGDVFSTYLYYVEAIRTAFPAARFICLRRDKQGTVQSFMRKVAPANHWMQHDGTRWMSDPWDVCFPKFDEPTIEAALAAYWDDYYQRAEQFQDRWPDQFRIFDLEQLNAEAGRSRILSFAGIPEPHVHREVRHNRG